MRAFSLRKFIEEVFVGQVCPTDKPSNKRERKVHKKSFITK